MKTNAIEEEFVTVVVDKLPMDELKEDEAATNELFKFVSVSAAELEFVAIVADRLFTDELSDDDVDR